MEYKYFTLNTIKCLLATIKKVFLSVKDTWLLGKIDNISNDRWKNQVNVKHKHFQQETISR